MERQFESVSQKGIGVYIHVPFCASKCSYCDFYSRVRQDQKAGYLDALEQEMFGWKNRGLKADTVFFGGGTPSLLTPSELERIVHAVKTNFALLPDAEVTMGLILKLLTRHIWKQLPHWELTGFLLVFSRRLTGN